MNATKTKKLTLPELLRDAAERAPKRVATWLRKLADGDSARSKRDKTPPKRA